jgi:hypothetical protein
VGISVLTKHKISILDKHTDELLCLAQALAARMNAGLKTGHEGLICDFQAGIYLSKPSNLENYPGSTSQGNHQE